ncbi:MAG: M48 family metallopeptidase [Verrucomicrobiae bacterium]|nr:M48 family metallopeptidase [Verrucomicrobiae bacterium]
MREMLQVDGLEFEIRRSDRRKTLGLTVDRAGDLVAHAPTATEAAELERWIEKKLLWVYRKLAQKAEMAPQVKAPEFVSGEGFCYLGKRYRLKVVAKQEEPLHFTGAGFRLRSGIADPEAAFRTWYLGVGDSWLKERVNTFAPRADASPKDVLVRDLGFNWGACGRDGSLYFNWKLLQLPVKLIDYVVMHELIHLREHHHGPEFWSALERAMPDWKLRKESLAGSAREFLRFGLVESSD